MVATATPFTRFKTRDHTNINKDYILFKNEGPAAATPSIIFYQNAKAQAATMFIVFVSESRPKQQHHIIL